MTDKPDLKGLAQKIMKQMQKVKASETAKKLDNEKRIGEIRDHISFLMDGVNERDFLSQVSHIHDIGFRLGINSDDMRGVKLGVLSTNNCQLLWTNIGFAEAQNQVLQKESIKPIEFQAIPRYYNIDEVKQALSNVMLAIWTRLPN